jgi:hypothetical protein
MGKSLGLVAGPVQKSRRCFLLPGRLTVARAGAVFVEAFGTGPSSADHLMGAPIGIPGAAVAGLSIAGRDRPTATTVPTTAGANRVLIPGIADPSPGAPDLAEGRVPKYVNDEYLVYGR